MLFDPEAEKTREKIYALAWKTLTPAIQAQRQVLAEAADKTVGEGMEEYRARFEAHRHGPGEAERRQVSMDFQEQPYGPDPLLRKGSVNDGEREDRFTPRSRHMHR